MNSTTTAILIVLSVLVVLYVLRRRARVGREARQD
jgi:hypothetical protein